MTEKLTKLLSFTLSIMIVLQPVLGFAQSVVVAGSNGAKVDTAANGVPILNIANPNSNGLSHNQFDKFNVTSQGLIINNSANAVASTLGGAVVGNPNFSGAEASLILNEVTSNNRTSLEGFQELVGKSAEYILANPNGITCNGCGFIDFPKATLTTGVPVFSAGSLIGLDINGGDIAVEGSGLNASNIDYFDLISRRITIDGNINAKNINLITGRNNYNLSTKIATAKATTIGSQPLYAIDSTSLGGMYANKIYIIATEDGVGVNMRGDMAASASDIEINAKGIIKFVNNDVSAKNNIKLTTNDDVYIGESTVYADKNLTATANDITVATSSTVGSGGDTILNATNNLNISNSDVYARNNLIGTFNNGYISYGEVGAGNDVSLTGTSLTVKKQQNYPVTIIGKNRPLYALNDINIDATTVTFEGLGNPQVEAGNNLNITATTFTNKAVVTTGNNITIKGTTVNNTATLHSTNNLYIGGLVSSPFTTSFTNSGIFTSDADTTLELLSLVNSSDINIGNDFNLTLKSPFNNQQNIIADNNININTNNDFSNLADISAGNNLDLTTSSYVENLSGGTLSASNDLFIDAGYIVNDDFIFAGRNMQLLATNSLSNNVGASIFAVNNIILGAKDIASIATNTVRNNEADIESLSGNITINAKDFTNERVRATLTDRTIRTQPTTDFYFKGIKVSGARCGTYGNHAGKSDDGYKCMRSVKDYEQIYDTTAYNNAHKQARLIAGGNININFTNILNNKYSLISAVGDINIDGLTTGTLNNVSLVRNKQRYSDQTVTYHTGNSCPVQNAFGNKCFYDGWWWKKTFSSWYRTDGTLYQINDANAKGIIEAGNTLTIANVATVNNNGDQSGGISIPAPTNKSNPGGTFTPTSITSLLPNLSDLPKLFVVSKNPSSRYLIETNPKFNLKNLLGSDYLLKRLDYDTENIRRLGDDFYETQLVRDQILDLTGSRFLDSNIIDETKQYQVLMDNAVLASADLQLSVGIELSSAQINSLKQNIVWMVEKEVDGQKVLVPQVYLASIGSNILPAAGPNSGSTLSGKNVKILNSDEVNNSGTITASENTFIDSNGSINNNQGVINAGNTLTMVADEDITNTSGLINGNNVSLDAGGDIINKTIRIRDSRDENGDGKDDFVETTFGRTATINANNQLDMSAGNNIDIIGAEVNAGGNATINAKNDINIIHQEDETISTKKSKKIGFWGLSGSESFEQERTVKVRGSGLNIGGNLGMTSGNDINVTGSNVKVGGDASLDAGNDINITAVKEVYEKTTFNSDSGFTSDTGRDGSQVNAQAGYEVNTHGSALVDETIVGSGITSGGNLKLNAKNDVNLTGSTLDGGTGVEIEASNDVNILAIKENDSYTETNSSEGAGVYAGAGLDKTSTGLYEEGSNDELNINSTVHTTSSIKSGGNLKIKSGNDITEEGASFEAKNDINIDAGNDFNSVAVNDTFDVDYESSEHRTEFGAMIKTGLEDTVASITDLFGGDGDNLRQEGEKVTDSKPTLNGGLGGGYNQTDTEFNNNASIAKTSKYKSGGNFTVKAGNNINLEGTEVDAGGNLDLDAKKDVNITAAEDSFSSSGKTSTAGGELFASPKTFGASGGYTGAKYSEKATFAKTSNLKAGGNANIKAGNDVNLEGTNVKAEKDINLTATNGSVDFKAAKDTYSYSDSLASGKGSAELNVFSVGSVGASGAGGESSIEASNAVTGSLNAGGNLNIKSKKDITLEGTDITAGKDAKLKAEKGDINFKAAEDTYVEKSTYVSAKIDLHKGVGTKGKGVNLGKGKAGKLSGKANEAFYQVTKKGRKAGGDIGASVQTSDIDITRKNTGSITTGGNLDMSAGNDITLEGVQGKSGGDMSIDAGNDLNIVSAQDTVKSKTTDVDAALGLFSTGADVETMDYKSTTNQNALLNAGGNVKLKSGNTTKIAGGNVEGETVNVNAKKLVIESRVDTESYTGGEGGLGYGGVGGGAGTATAPVHVAGDVNSVNSISGIKGRSGVTIEGTNGGKADSVSLTGAYIDGGTGGSNINTKNLSTKSIGTKSFKEESIFREDTNQVTDSVITGANINADSKTGKFGTNKNAQQATVTKTNAFGFIPTNDEKSDATKRLTDKAKNADKKGNRAKDLKKEVKKDLDKQASKDENKGAFSFFRDLF